MTTKAIQLLGIAAITAILGILVFVDISYFSPFSITVLLVSLTLTLVSIRLLIPLTISNKLPRWLGSDKFWTELILSGSIRYGTSHRSDFQDRDSRRKVAGANGLIFSIILIISILLLK